MSTVGGRRRYATLQSAAVAFNALRICRRHSARPDSSSLSRPHHHHYQQHQQLNASIHSSTSSSSRRDRLTAAPSLRRTRTICRPIPGQRVSSICRPCYRSSTSITPPSVDEQSVATPPGPLRPSIANAPRISRFLVNPLKSVNVIIQCHIENMKFASPRVGTLAADG